MTLKEFNSIFISFRTNIDELVIWQGGKCVASKSIGDTRYIKPEYLNAKVKHFTFPKRTRALFVFLQDEEKHE